MKEIIEIIVLAVLFMVGGAVGGYEYCNSGWQKRENKALVQAQQKVSEFTKLNDQLVLKSAQDDAQVRALSQQVANQLPKERVVYVNVKSVSTKQSTPVAVTGPVYVTWGAVRLFNDTLGLPQVPKPEPTGPGASDLPSLVTVSDYELTTTHNNVACLANQGKVARLAAYVHGLVQAGVVQGP